MNPQPHLRPQGTSRNERGKDVAEDDSRVIRALEGYLAAIEEGLEPDRPGFLNRHASIAHPLAACLDGLELVHRAASRAWQATC